MRGYILDVEYTGGSHLKLLIKGETEMLVEDAFYPYFYYDGREEDLKDDADKIEKIERVNLEKKLLKVTVKDYAYIHELKNKLKEHGNFYEYDIPPQFRYFIDRGIFAGRTYDFEIKENKIVSIKNITDTLQKPKMCAFDIEVYNKRGVPNPKEDPVLLIGVYDGKQKKSFFWTKEKGSEKEMIQDFINFVKDGNYDVIVGYNSSNFDFPYLKKRCHELGIKLNLGRDGSEVQIRRSGVFQKAYIFGRVHLDAFDSVEFLTGISAMRLPANDLDSVYYELFKKEKIKVDCTQIYKYWENGGKDFEMLKEYNIQDATASYEIGEEVLPLFFEVSKIVGFPLYEVARMSTAQMVEWLLIREAHNRKILVPQKVDEDTARTRMRNPIKGAFVKLPESGLHERIVVCDFRSLYPSIIISHNVSPDTLDCTCCKDAFVAPEVGHRFCKKKQGIIPYVLQELFDVRAAAKKEMKKLKEGTQEYRALHFKQWGLKIILNSSYGYMGYGRARWYSREAAESVTAWARHYIQDVIAKAEKEGFHVLYGDTDSFFLKLKSKKEVKDVENFVETINKGLAEKMELEFEGYYPRGIFVSKREGSAAKKRYALIREDGTVEIVGFEFVRRDWANIAKRTQEKVISAVLREGNPQKAIEVVKKVVEKIKKREVSLEDLIIHTQLIRKVSAYEQQAPHVKAAKKLIEAGYKVPVGSDLEFVVVEGKGSISDRSIPVQLLKQNTRYDAEYYIKNQVLGAVMKILNQLGVSEEELCGEAMQQGLEKWT
jgi:DNA polymerase I